MIDVTEFGKRVQNVREDLLKMTQTELAPHLDIDQALLSRLERGVGGNIIVVFKIIDFLFKRNLPAHMLFKENFDISLLTKVDVEVVTKNELVADIEEIEKESYKNYKKIITLREDISKLRM